jgi:phenylpropionate dioxygenase-like ring-hydroxylating dioxygenase large terminal subunit
MRLSGFEPSEHSLFKIHTHTTAQGFIFVNFDSAASPTITFTDQFGDDFDPSPTSTTGKVIGNEYSLFPNSGWEYDHTWESSIAGTNYN